jgi:hypothetical protein
VIATKYAGRLALIKNYDPVWLMVELSHEQLFSPFVYQEMEERSGLCFHMYIVDLDKDTHLDIILPDLEQHNSIIMAKNPGKEYF